MQYFYNLACIFQKHYLNIVIEFCPAGELFYHLTLRKKFAEKHAKFIICEVVLALEYLHSQNILYRDLKVKIFLFIFNFSYQHHSQKIYQQILMVILRLQISDFLGKILVPLTLPPPSVAVQNTCLLKCYSKANTQKWQTFINQVLWPMN